MSYWDRVPGWALAGAVIPLGFLWVVVSVWFGRFVDKWIDPNGVPAGLGGRFAIAVVVEIVCGLAIFGAASLVRLIIAIWR